MADSFVADSFTPDTPAPKAKADEKPEQMGPAGKYVDPIANLPGIGGRLAAMAKHIVNPQTAAEHVQSIGASAPLFGLARGAAAAMGAPAITGPMAVGGTLGAAGAAERGESGASTLAKTALGAITTGATELGITKLLGNPSAVKMFEKAKNALPAAYEAIKSRLWVHPVADEAIITVPSMGGALKVSEAVKRLGELRDEAYTAAVDEVRHGMNALDFSKNQVKAGDAFVARLVKGVKSGNPELFEPMGKAKKALTSDTAKDVADALTSQNVYGIPVGAALPLAVPGAAGKIPEMAAKMFLR